MERMHLAAAMPLLAIRILRIGLFPPMRRTKSPTTSVSNSTFSTATAVTLTEVRGKRSAPELTPGRKEGAQNSEVCDPASHEHVHRHYVGFPQNSAENKRLTSAKRKEAGQKESKTQVESDQHPPIRGALTVTALRLRQEVDAAVALTGSACAQGAMAKLIFYPDADQGKQNEQTPGQEARIFNDTSSLQQGGQSASSSIPQSLNPSISKFFAPSGQGKVVAYIQDRCQ